MPLTLGTWTTSSRCSADQPSCVEVATISGMNGPSVLVRDGKSSDPAAVQIYSADEWRAFLDGVKAGDFDLPA
jgi:hypothetical protein